MNPACAVALLYTWLVPVDSEATASASSLQSTGELLRLRWRLRSVATEMVPRRLSLYFGNSLYSTDHQHQSQLYSVSQKSSLPPKTFFQYFLLG